MGAVFLCRFEPIQLRRSRAKTRILSIILCFSANAELTGAAIMFFRKCGINRRRPACKRARPVEKMAV